MKDPKKDPDKKEEKKSKVVVERKPGDPSFNDEKSFTKYYADKAAERLAKEGKYSKMTDDPKANKEVNVATKAKIPDYKSYASSDAKTKTMAGKEVKKSNITTGYNQDGKAPVKVKSKLISKLKKRQKNKGY